MATRLAESPELLTPVQVAKVTGLSTATLAKARVYGTGPAFIKLGASVRYPDDAVAEWLAARARQRSTSESTGALASLTSVPVR